MSRNLLLIDPQNDFMDNGTLPVKGSIDDCKRIAQMIGRIGNAIDSIIVTLDDHPLYHISHPIMFIDKDGRHPDPFTKIYYDDIMSSKPKFMASVENHEEYVKDYIVEITKAGEDGHVIWPYHCISGSVGQGIYHELHDAINNWEKYKKKNLRIFRKGNFPFAEQTSAVQAKGNPLLCGVNMDLLMTCARSEVTIVAGEAMDVCVAETIKDLVDKQDSIAGKLIILEDAMSAVNPGGDTSKRDSFIEWAKSVGIQFTTTDKLLL